MSAPSADEKDQRAPVGIAALDDGSEASVGLDATKQRGGLDMGRQAFSQADIRPGR